MSNIWGKLKKPFFVLAPMADVTDASFRRIIAKYGKPDVFWTEFVSADGLVSAGFNKLKIDLIYSKKEKPIIAQLFSSDKEKMRKAAKIVASMGFDGIDINMGCPDRKIEKQGAGAAMIKDMERARDIIEAVKKGINDANKNIPVSVKTRVGYNKVEIDKWIPFLLNCNIDALTIHARTRKEMSKVPARWEHVREVVEIRDKMKVKTKIIGNGDVGDIKEARLRIKETGCDGVMLGRAIFGNPWLFSGKIPSTKDKLHVLIEHTKLFHKLLGEYKNFSIMKKHYKAYVNGFDGAKELRTKLMEAKDWREVQSIIDEFLS